MELITPEEKSKIKQILTKSSLLHTADERKDLLSLCNLERFCDQLQLNQPLNNFIISIYAKLSKSYVTVGNCQKLALVIFLDNLSRIDSSLSREEQDFIRYIIAKWEQQPKIEPQQFTNHVSEGYKETRIIKPFQLIVSIFITIVIAIIVPVGIWLVSTNEQLKNSSTTSEDWQTYEKEYEFEDGDQVKFILKYPNNWDEKNIEDNFLGDIAQFCPKTKKVNISTRVTVSLHVENLQKKMMLVDGYAKSVIEQLKISNEEFELIDKHQDALSKYSAYRIVYKRQATKASPELKQIEVITLHQGKAYFITYQAEERYYNKYLSVAENMIDSFEMIDTK